LSFFSGVILLDSPSSQNISKTKIWKQPKMSRRLGRHIDGRGFKNINTITRTVPSVLAPPTRSRRARRKNTMATLKSELRTARRQTKLVTMTYQSTQQLLIAQEQKTISFKSSRDNEPSKMKDACSMLRESRSREQALTKLVDGKNRRMKLWHVPLL